MNAQFAEIDIDGTVLRVLEVPQEQAHRGETFLSTDLKLGGIWKQTSYTGSIGKNYAGIGMRFDKARDSFITDKPHDSWVMDETKAQWIAPISAPSDIRTYWDESIRTWVPIKDEK